MTYSYMGRVRFETDGAKSDTRNIIFGEFGIDGTFGYTKCSGTMERMGMMSLF